MICARPPAPPRRGGKGGAQRAPAMARAQLTRARGQRGGGKGGAPRAPAMTGINVPPFPPPRRGGKGGGKVHMAVDPLGQLLAALR